MARPDLNDPVERQEYRRELRAYLLPWRVAGLTTVIGAGIWLMLRDRESVAAWAVMILGWVFLVAIIVLRTRYHMRRMGETP